MKRVYSVLSPSCRWVCLGVMWGLLQGCAVNPPQRSHDLCSVFQERFHWFQAVREAEKRWNISIPIMMAIVYQESGFYSDARPPRTRILKYFPGPRVSSAYGYSQALNQTWKDYQHATGNIGAQRDDFSDSLDFVGWYNRRSLRYGISKYDARKLYLAYHEGHHGFKRRSYMRKPWLMKVARKVQHRARLYQRQYNDCRRELIQKDEWLKRPWYRRLFG